MTETEISYAYWIQQQETDNALRRAEAADRRAAEDSKRLGEMEAEILDLRQQLAKVEAERDRFREAAWRELIDWLAESGRTIVLFIALKRVVDHFGDTPCQLDEEGCCEAHFKEPVCSVQLARDTLKRFYENLKHDLVKREES